MFVEKTCFFSKTNMLTIPYCPFENHKTISFAKAQKPKNKPSKIQLGCLLVAFKYLKAETTNNHPLDVAGLHKKRESPRRHLLGPPPLSESSPIWKKQPKMVKRWWNKYFSPKQTSVERKMRSWAFAFQQKNSPKGLTNTSLEGALG